LSSAIESALRCPECRDQTEHRRILDEMLPLAIAIALSMAPAPGARDSVTARAAVDEAAFYARRDHGLLWGVALTTPLLIVDPANRLAVSGVADSAGLMVHAGGFFRATLPESVTLANTATTWGERTWAMVLSPLPADSIERGILLMHEIWHSVQARIGIPLSTPDNPHLETASGRTWLRVEGRALDSALARSGPARRQAMSDAIAARLLRRAAAPGSDHTEAPLELSEGLAEYTGIVVVVTPSGRARLGHARLARLETGGTLMRAFPYAIGTAWALLLDDVAPGWRKHLTATSDLAVIAAAALSVDTATMNRDDARFAPYDLAEVRATERAAEAVRVARQDSLRALYVSGPTLRLPLAEMNMSFDPNRVEALPGVGTVYRPFRLSDRWGSLDADSSGALVETGFQVAKVAKPAPGGMSGAGWRLTLNPGWEVVPATRSGDYLIQQR
jgi:hypothetical protein